jgi:hypothetical protein
MREFVGFHSEARVVGLGGGSGDLGELSSLVAWLGRESDRLLSRMAGVWWRSRHALGDDG